MSIIDLNSVRKLLDATAVLLESEDKERLLMDEVVFDKGNDRVRMVRSTARINDCWMECSWRTGDAGVDLVMCMQDSTDDEDVGPVAIARLKKTNNPYQIIDFWLRNRPPSQF